MRIFEIIWRRRSAGICLLLSFLMAAMMAVAAPFSSAASAQNAQFKDVPLKSWYCIYVRYAFTHGIMSGTSGTTFAPTENMTRAMTVQTLYNLAGRPAVEWPVPADSGETVDQSSDQLSDSEEAMDQPVSSGESSELPTSGEEISDQSVSSGGSPDLPADRRKGFRPTGGSAK